MLVSLCATPTTALLPSGWLTDRVILPAMRHAATLPACRAWTARGAQFLELMAAISDIQTRVRCAVGLSSFSLGTSQPFSKDGNRQLTNSISQ